VPSAVSPLLRQPGSGRKAVVLVIALLALLAATVVVLARSDQPAKAANGPRGESLFSATTTPKTVADTDRVPVEVGVRVRFGTAGTVTAVRFFRAAQNTGKHVGHVWSAGGAMLAEVTFADSAPGWQTALLAKPVPVQAGTEYVISYFAPKGAYSADVDFFSTRSITTSSLVAPSGRNGVYRYGATSAFPKETWRSSNYYVDLVFAPGNAGRPPAPLPTATSPGAPAPTATQKPAPTAGPVLPTSKPTPTPTTSTPSKPPAPLPPPGAYPGPNDTGVKGGTPLTDFRGELRVTKSGSVVKNMRVFGSISIEADDVTVENVEVICSSSWWIIHDKGRRTTIQDSTLTVDRSNSSNYCQYGITGGDGVKILRNDISFTPDGLTFEGGTAEIRDNWVHDQVAYAGKADHVDAAQLNGGGPGPYVFVGNHFSVPEGQTGCLALFADFGPIRNVTVQGNLFDGAGYSFYGGTDSATNVRVTDNAFGTTFYAKGGYFGPVTRFNPAGSGNQWSNNRWLGTGAPINP
jgi:Domain of unknown function (DUF4082)